MTVIDPDCLPKIPVGELQIVLAQVAAVDPRYAAPEQLLENYQAANRIANSVVTHAATYLQANDDAVAVLSGLRVEIQQARELLSNLTAGLAHEHHTRLNSAVAALEQASERIHALRKPHLPPPPASSDDDMPF